MGDKKEEKAENIARDLLRKLGPGPDIRQMLEIDEKDKRNKPRD